MVSDNTQVGCGILTMPSWYEGAQSVQENIQNTITPDGSMLSYCLPKIVVVAEIVLNMFCSNIPVLV